MARALTFLEVTQEVRRLAAELHAPRDHDRSSHSDDYRTLELAGPFAYGADSLWCCATARASGATWVEMRWGSRGSVAPKRLEQRHGNALAALGVCVTPAIVGGTSERSGRWG